jgi:hypothetical protein
MSCGFSDPGGCLADLAASAASSVASGAFSAIAHDFGSAAAAVTTWLWGQISSATAISFGGSGFALDWGITLGIGMIMCLLLFLVQVLASALRRDFSGLGRALRGVIIAGLGTFAALLVLQSLLGAVDALSADVVRAVTGGSIQQMGAKLFDGTAILSTNPAGLLLLALIALAACVVVWAAMMIRKLLVIVMAVFCPIAFSGAAADITASWVRRWIEAVVALAVSKLILVLIMAIGLSVLMDRAGSTGGATNSLTTSVIGLLILLMGGFAPWLAIKMVHFSG